MYNPFSSFPCVDGLIEGVHYQIVDWNFADGQGCPEGEKMVFGVCRKTGGSSEKDFDSSKKTQQEQQLEAEAAKQKSDVKSNKQVTVGGKKYGWAVKNGKPVLVEWGSVAGEKKVGPKPAAEKEKPKEPPKPSQSPSPKAVTPPKPQAPAAQALANNPNPTRTQVRDAVQDGTKRVFTI